MGRFCLPVLCMLDKFWSKIISEQASSGRKSALLGLEDLVDPLAIKDAVL